jgi:hypothetical protein
MKFISTLCFFVLLTCLIATPAAAQNVSGNRWLVWYPELGSTGSDAPNAAFSIKAAENTLADIVGSPTSNPSNSYAIGNDLRGYVYYDDRANSILRVIDPLQQAVIGTYNYSGNNIKDIHALQAFYISATNRHYMAVANLYGDLSLTAVAIFDVTNPNAITFVKHILCTGIVKQYAGIIPSLTFAGRITGMTLGQSAYTSAATTLFLATDDGVKLGSLTNVTVGGVPNRHPGVYVKITDPLGVLSPVTINEAYYNSTHFLAPTGTGGPHQIMYDQENNLVYVSAESTNKILSFDATTGAPTNNVYAATVNPTQGGFHALNLNRRGTELYAGRAGGGAGQDRAYKFRTENSKASPQLVAPEAVSPELWSTADPIIKGVNLTPDETYLYAISETPGGVFLLDKNTMNVIQQSRKTNGTNAVFAKLDPHSYAFTLHDYGDAPVSYGRVAHNLCNNTFVADNLRIGDYVDGDTVVGSSSGAFTDDVTLTPAGDDEDGITPAIISSLSGLYTGMTGTYTIADIPVRNRTGLAANMVAWIDFNHNGTFEPAEGTVSTVPNNANRVTLTWNIPSNATGGAFYLRMRLTHDLAITVNVPHSVVASGGEAAFDGEVEDHYLNPIVAVSGNLFNDANGNGVKPGTGEPNVGVTSLFAYLVINSTIIDKTNILADGTFQFIGSPQNTNNAHVILGVNNVAIGANSSSIVKLSTNPPAGWVYTGESHSNSADGVMDAVLSFNLGNVNLNQKNFGIERLPDSDPKVYVLWPPSLNSFMTLNGSGLVPGPLSGSDIEDGTLGAGKKVAITSLPNNANELWYNGVKITTGANGLTAPSPTNPFTINNYDPNLLQVRFTAVGSLGTEFRYAYIDAADKQDPVPATYTLSWGGALSAQGLQLSASRNGSAVVLNWFTLTESNTSHFDLERSVDGVNYQSIGKINAAGSSNARKNYSLTDNAVPASTVYYRVRLNDIDGKKTYSNTVSVITKSITGQVAVNPNPVSTRYNVTMQAPQGGVGTLQLVDLSGKTVWTKQYNLQKGQNFISINRTTEAKGIYVMVFRVNDTMATQKLIINDK